MSATSSTPCAECGHARWLHTDGASPCTADDCACQLYLVPPQLMLPGDEVVVEPVLCTACDHPVESHHPLLGCQQQVPGGLLVATHTCPCALAPQVRSALLEVGMDMTEAYLADRTAEGDVDPIAADAAPADPTDVARAAYLLGLCTHALHSLGYPADEGGPYHVVIPLAGGKEAHLHCHVEPSRNQFG